MKQIIFIFFLNTIGINSFAFSPVCGAFASAQFSHSYSVVPTHSSQLSLVTWNTHKLKDPDTIKAIGRIGTSADLLFLQEAMYSDQWQTALIEELPMNFVFYKSFCFLNHEITGVMTASRFSLLNSQALRSGDREPISYTHKVAGYSSFYLNGTLIHLINIHSLNFNDGRPFEHQIDFLVEFASHLNGPLIWAGDFNTWNNLRIDYLLAQTKKLNLIELLPDNEVRNRILDHIFVRGFKIIRTEIVNETSSDHFPLRATIELN